MMIGCTDRFSDSLLPGFMRRDINSPFGWIASLTRRVWSREGNKVRCSVGEREAVLEDIIKDFSNAEERVECKKLKKELEEARGVVFKERPNEAIDVPVKDEESPSSESRESPRDS
nr:hypothetical protein [Tanacetum cinerariifolium]